jgi:FixJ family two-component response regulator
VIDDDEDIVRAVRRLLRSAEHAIDTFASTEEFLDLGSQARPDCLVLDVHLRGPSGFDLQDLLEASERLIPIVFITAHDDAGRVTKCNGGARSRRALLRGCRADDDRRRVLP